MSTIVFTQSFTLKKPEPSVLTKGRYNDPDTVNSIVKGSIQPLKMTEQLVLPGGQRIH